MYTVTVIEHSYDNNVVTYANLSHSDAKAKANDVKGMAKALGENVTVTITSQA